MKAYINAAYGSHADGKSHSGLVLKFGNACVMLVSSKEKIVTKSSTEAEMVALSDMLKHVEIYNKLIKLQGNCMETPPTIMQDNQSIISLVTKGGEALHNKHLRVKLNLVKEAVDNLRIKIEFVPTRKMLADGQTKPVQGTWRDVLTQQLMGLSNNKIGCDRQQGCVEETIKLDRKWQGNNGQRIVVLSALANLEKNSRLMHVEKRLHTYTKKVT